MYEFDIRIGYAGGSLAVEFDGDSYPEDWMDVVEYARAAAEEQLYDIADIHKWRHSFDTAQTYSMPGETPEAIVGTLQVSEDGDYEVDLDIENLHDIDW